MPKREGRRPGAPSFSMWSASPGWYWEARELLAGLSGGERALLACLTVAGAGLGVALARSASRRRLLHRLRHGGEDCVVRSPALLQPGMPAFLRVSGCGCVPVRGTLERITRHSLELRVDGGAWPDTPPGTPLFLTLGHGSRALELASLLQGARGEGSSVRVLASRPRWVASVQRREFFRVPVALPTLVHPLGDVAVAPAFRALIVDVSAGGCRLAVRRPLEPGVRVRVEVALDSSRDAAFVASVRACEPNPGSAPWPFLLRCEFEGLDDATRDRIVCWCFGEERRLRAMNRR